MGFGGGRIGETLETAEKRYWASITATRVAKFPQATVIQGSFPVPKRTPLAGGFVPKWTP